MSESWEKIEAIREKYRNQQKKPSTAREFAAIYSWAVVDKNDKSYVICKFCKYRMGTRTSNLVRHQYSIRHMLSTKEIDPSDVERGQITLIPKCCDKREFAAIFSWAMVDKTNESFVICKLCNCRMAAKKGTIRKHQYSIRHRMSTKEIDPSDVERGQIPPIPKRLKSCGKREVSLPCIDRQERIPEREETSTNSNDPDFQMHSNSDDDFDEQSYGHNASPSPNNSSDMVQQTRFFDCMVQTPTSLSTSHNVRTNTDITADQANLEPKIEQSDVEPEQIPAIPESPGIHSYGDDQITSESIDNPVTPTDKTPDQATPIQVEPWKIIISNVRGAEPPTQAVSPVKSTATVTPLPITTQQYRESAVSSPSRSNHNVKNSFDLFFESVCATVKSLPPKLATEGKMRVMQLIGELEMRAIEERDQQMITGNDSIQL